MVSESGCFSFIRIPASFRSYSISEDQICGSGCGICKRFFSKNLISLNWYRCSIQEASGWAIGYHFRWVLRSAGKERPLCWIPLHENTTQVVLLCFLFWILAVAMTFFFTSRVQNSFTKPLPTWTIMVRAFCDCLFAYIGVMLILHGTVQSHIDKIL